MPKNGICSLSTPRSNSTWRSDAAASLPQAEEVGIALLRDERHTFHEAFEGFRFTRFDGTVVEV